MNQQLLLLYLLIGTVQLVKCNQPNIIVIIADDLGWNDVGFHGNNLLKTPNIDALAYNGVILNRHYVLPSCTPSRTALLTGKYPIRTGFQGHPLGSTAPKALSLNHTLLPQYLQNLGYKTHLIGKWHIGHYKEKYTPTKRGFHTFFGYYNGWIRYNDSVTDSFINTTFYSGYDARRNLQRAKEEFEEKYATDIFTDEAVKIIKQHNKQSPLYLQVSHVAVHAVRGNLLQVRDINETNEEFGYIKDESRRLFAGVLKALDDSVGSIILALNATELLSNSIILFISDNGGATSDSLWHLSNTGSNWPLRGQKISLAEGGVRGTAAIWSPLIQKSQVSNQLIHISDWLPTFYAAAGGNVDLLQNLDGVNQWQTLTSNSKLSSREELLINIDDKINEAAYIHKNWKLLQINQEKKFKSVDKYSGSIDREGEYNISDVVSSSTNRILRTFASSKSESLESQYLGLRQEAEVRCPNSSPEERNKTNLDRLDCFKTVCLFDIASDPCEQHDLSHFEPKITDTLKAKIAKLFSEIVKPDYLNDNDVRSNPELWGGYWSPWLPDRD